MLGLKIQGGKFVEFQEYRIQSFSIFFFFLAVAMMIITKPAVDSQGLI